VTDQAIRRLIRDVPDFPEPGIVFKDITPLLGDVDGFATAVQLLADRIHKHGPEGLVAIESRGFLFGAALAIKMKLPLQLVRKPNKLPYRTIGISYDLEYGSDRVEVHSDAIRPGYRYAVIDDLIATGGTASATVELIERCGGAVACLAFLVELSFLRGVGKLGDYPVETVVQFD